MRWRSLIANCLILSLVVTTSLIPVAPVRADLDATEIVGTLAGAGVAAVLAATIAPLGVAFAGIVGGLLTAMVLGVGVERFFLDGVNSSTKIKIVYSFAAVGFLIGAPLMGMLAAQLPLLGIVGALVAGGSVGMQVGQSISEGDSTIKDRSFISAPFAPTEAEPSSQDDLTGAKEDRRLAFETYRRALTEKTGEGILKARELWMHAQERFDKLVKEQLR